MVLGELVFQTKLFQRLTTRKLDTVSTINVDHNDLHLVTDLADVFYAINVAIRQFADVTQTITTWQDFNERTEVFNATNGTVVDLANLNRCGASFDFLQCSLGQVAIGTSDCDATVFRNFHNGVGFFLNCANVLAAWADQHTNLLWIDVGDQQTRSVF